MLDKFDYGFNRAIEEIIGGIVTSVIIDSAISTGLIPSYFIFYFHLINIASMIGLIIVMPVWAASYIVGWLFGVIILATTGLLTILDFLIYLIPIGFLVYRLYK